MRYCRYSLFTSESLRPSFPSLKEKLLELLLFVFIQHCLSIMSGSGGSGVHRCHEILTAYSAVCDIERELDVMVDSNSRWLDKLQMNSGKSIHLNWFRSELN